MVNFKQNLKSKIILLLHKTLFFYQNLLQNGLVHFVLKSNVHPFKDYLTSDLHALVIERKDQKGLKSTIMQQYPFSQHFI